MTVRGVKHRAMGRPRVRVRGMYATALTRLLRDEGFGVVRSSDAIRERFDAEFGDEHPDAWIRDARDRQGIEVSGEADGVREVTDILTDAGDDCFPLNSPLSELGVYDGEVTGTLGGGALVEVSGLGEAFLPFSESDQYISEGDRLRVQIINPEAPWTDRRPVCTTRIRVSTEGIELVRGDDWSREVYRLLEMMQLEAPGGWAVTEQVEIACVEDELPACIEMAHALEDELRDAGPPGEGKGALAEPFSTRFIRFGRKTKFSLDGFRRKQVPTMWGHHRLKSSHEAAGGAVDFYEALEGETDEFPFPAVLRAFGPRVGSTVHIDHGKPDGRTIRLGRATVTDVDPEGWEVTVEREMRPGGRYDGLDVPKEEGDVAKTTLREGEWHYRTDYRGTDGSLKGSYVNVCTPVEIRPRAVTYVDLYVDVVQFPDGTTKIIDRKELEDTVESGLVTRELADRALDVAEAVEQELHD